MAGIGLSRAFVARYNDDGFGNITYTGGRQFAKAIEFRTEYNGSKTEVLYADNAPAETANVFSGGSLTLKTDEFDNDASKLLLGVEETPFSYAGKSVAAVINKASDTSPILGFGTVLKNQKNNATKYTAVILPKLVFSVPVDAAKTQGESIEWQTPELTASIMLDDTPNHNWRYKAEFATEAAAAEFIKYLLGMLPDFLRVTSAAGTATGTTNISVSPVKPAGSNYKYVLGTEVYAPDRDTTPSDSFKPWDGSAAISATTGQKILVVEVDNQNKVKRAGTAAVVVK